MSGSTDLSDPNGSDRNIPLLLDTTQLQNAGWQRDLSVSHDRIGMSARVASGRPPMPKPR
jgi:hypothetical protein